MFFCKCKESAESSQYLNTTTTVIIIIIIIIEVVVLIGIEVCLCYSILRQDILLHTFYKTTDPKKHHIFSIYTKL